MATSFLKNTLAQIGGRLLYLLTRVGLPPLILHYVSLEEYGLWATCFLVIGYISMGTFGVSNVYIRYVAEYHAQQKYESISGLISTGLFLTCLFSVIALTGLWFAMPLLMGGFNIDAALQTTATWLILGTVATMLLDMTFGALAFVLHGLQRIAQQTLVWIISFLLETAVIVSLLLLDYGVFSLLWAFAVRYVFSTFVYVILCYRSIPEFHIGFQHIQRRFFATFFKYGGILQLSGLLSIAMYSIERVLAGYTSGLAAIAILDLGQKFPVMASQVFSSMNAGFLPAITHAHQQNKTEEIQRLYTQGMRYLFLINGLAMGFLAPFAALLLRAWIGPDSPMDETQTIGVLVCACLGYQLHVLTGPLSAYYQGINHPAKSLIYISWQVVFVIIGLVYAWYDHRFDVLTLAFLVMLARVGSALVYLLQGNHRLGLGLGAFIVRVLWPGLLPYIFGYGLIYALKPWLAIEFLSRWQLIPFLGLCGVVYSALTLLFFYAFLCRKDEQNLIRQKIQRRKAA